jgi:tight adherence protein B
MNQWGALAAAGGAAVLFAYAVYSFWTGTRGKAARRIRTRLEALTAERPQSIEATLIKDVPEARSDLVERLIARTPRVEHVKRMIVQAGLAWTADTFFAATAVCFFIGFLVALVFVWWVLALAVGVAAAFLPTTYVSHQRNKRLQAFETQFPETLDLISRALRAGHAFGSGLKVAAEEGPEPMAGEFRMATDEINFGLSLPQALLNFADRVPLADIRFFVTAVLIQRETGGNLTEILGNISALIRERLRLLANVRVLSAEGRFSAWILIALPIFAGGAILVLNPGYLTVLVIDPLGKRILTAGAVFMFLGIVWMRRMVRIRV